MSASDDVVVRPFELKDQAAVYKMWIEGFQELFWEMSFMAYQNPKLLAALGLGSGLPLAVLLRLSATSPAGIEPKTVVTVAACYAVAAAGIWALSAPIMYFAALMKFQPMFKASEMTDIQKNWVEAKGRAFWVACLADGTVVGATGLRTERPEKVAEASGSDPQQAVKDKKKSDRDLEEGEAELLRMTVSSKHRRMKLGTKLLTAAEAHATASGMERITLVTGSEVAMGFYERNGYQTVSEMKYHGKKVKTYKKLM